MECVGDEGLREEFMHERELRGMREMSLKDQYLVF